MAKHPSFMTAPPTRNDRQIVVFGILLATIVLAYFYAVDNLYFSTRGMAQIFRYLLMVDDFNTAWLSLGVCVLAAFWTNAEPFLKVADFVGTHGLAVATAAVVAFALGALFIYHDNPFSMDEYAAVFQAKVFAAGRLTGIVPPAVVDWLIPPGFNGVFLVASHKTGEVIEAYWPGFSLILASFEFLGIPWLCNASLAGLAIFLIHRITFDITDDRRAAGWAVVFAIASGAFVANAMSYYSMQAHLTANLLYAWLLLKPTPRRALLAGAVGSIALILHNPFPHAMFAAPWIVAITWSKMRPRPIIYLACGYLPLLVIVGAVWLHVRSQVAAGSIAFDVESKIINDVFRLPSKQIIDMRVAATVKMWIWGVPCLILFAVLGLLRRRDNQHVRLLALSAGMTFLGYVFVVFDQGHGWGYRYFHSAWGAVPVLAGCAMSGGARSKGPLAAFAGAVAALNLMLVVPYQLMQIDSLIASHSAQLPGPMRPGNDVYFVNAYGGFYMADLVQMDPFLRDRDLVLCSAGSVADTALRRQNWPDAVLVERRPGVEEWNLGPIDQRVETKEMPTARRFLINFAK